MVCDRKYGSPQNAITVWKDHMVSQGFGYKLGVDLPSEGRGLIPNAAFYDKPYKGRWNGLTVISIAIGQGEILATHLQICKFECDDCQPRTFYHSTYCERDSG